MLLLEHHVEPITLVVWPQSRWMSIPKNKSDRPRISSSESRRKTKDLRSPRDVSRNFGTPKVESRECMTSAIPSAAAFIRLPREISQIVGFDRIQKCTAVCNRTKVIMRYRKLRLPTTIATAIYFLGLVVFLTAPQGGNAFQSVVSPSKPGHTKNAEIRTNEPCNNPRLVCTASSSAGTRNRNRSVAAFGSPPPGREGEDSLPKIVDAGELDRKQLEEMISEPPIEFEWRVLQQMLGINIFTVILAALIVFFLSMNAVLGPGWLGSTLGIPGTGNIEEVSPALPGSLDLNRPEYRL